MTSLHQSHLNELEQQKISQSQKSPDIRTNFEDLSSSSVADPVFVPRREPRSLSSRPALPLTPFSNTLNPGPQLSFESVERKAQRGPDNVDNWRRVEREVQDASSRKGRISVDYITQRDSKRPSERPRDKEYHRRFSGGFALPVARNDAVY
jgi:hypothetical protein